MRFFTRGWANGELSDAEAENVPKAYRKHVRTLWPAMPAALARLARTNLHDALISSIRLDRRAKTLVLVVVAEDDRDRSCSEISLSYFDVEISERNVETLKSRARDRESEILYDEIDLDADGRFVHRLLFWPEGEVSIWFRKFSIRKAGRQDIRIQMKPYFLIEE